MKKIYSKDECAPDALSAIQWLNEKLKQTGDQPIDFLKRTSIEVTHEFNQDHTRYFWASDHHYKIEYSCGVFEDLYEIAFPELIEELTKSAQSLLIQQEF